LEKIRNNDQHVNKRIQQMITKFVIPVLVDEAGDLGLDTVSGRNAKLEIDFSESIAGSQPGILSIIQTVDMYLSERPTAPGRYSLYGEVKIAHDEVHISGVQFIESPYRAPDSSDDPVPTYSNGEDGLFRRFRHVTGFKDDTDYVSCDIDTEKCVLVRLDNSIGASPYTLGGAVAMVEAGRWEEF